MTAVTAMSSTQAEGQGLPGSMEPPRRSLVHLANLPLIVSSALILLAVMRAYYFSNLCVSVALEMLAVVNWSSVLLGTILPLLVNCAPLILALSIGNWKSLVTEKGPRGVLSWAVLLLIAPLVLVEMPVYAFIANVVMVLALIWSSRTKRPWLKSLRSGVGIRVFVIAAIAGTTVPVLMSPWQAPEKVTYGFHDMTVMRNGYVVGEQAGRLLLVDVLGRVVWIKSDDVLSRETCFPVNHGDRPWWTVSISSIRYFGIYDPCDSTPGGILSIQSNPPGHKPTAAFP